MLRLTASEALLTACAALKASSADLMPPLVTALLTVEAKPATALVTPIGETPHIEAIGAKPILGEAPDKLTPKLTPNWVKSSPPKGLPAIPSVSIKADIPVLVLSITNLD